MYIFCRSLFSMASSVFIQNRHNLKTLTLAVSGNGTNKSGAGRLWFPNEAAVTLGVRSSVAATPLPNGVAV